MGLLGTTALLSLTLTMACYSPELRDCTIACVGPHDCASGQICGADGLCASIERAGRCSQLPSDAGTQIPDDAATEVTMPDASMPDAPPDAPTRGAITLTIEGKGYVILQNVGTCDSDPPQDGACQFSVPLSVPVSMRAYSDVDWRFDRWTTSACPNGTSESCTFVPQVAMDLGVKFRRDNDD